MSRKYELTNETKKFRGIKHYRIRALRDFGSVKAGDLGGFVGGVNNLSREGNCWISGGSCVSDNALISENAYISGYSLIWDISYIHGNTVVTGKSRIYGKSAIDGILTLENVVWSLNWGDNPDACFFNSGLVINEAVVQTRKDFLRQFPEWCI